MSSERPTIRPVSLARLVEGCFLIDEGQATDEQIAAKLELTHHRTREIVLEADRLDFLMDADADPEGYELTSKGTEFLESIVAEDWRATDRLLRSQSPHYGDFVEEVSASGPIAGAELQERLETSTSERYEFNETSMDVLCDWGQRLGAVQRNVFSGALYVPDSESLPAEFPAEVVTCVQSMEETTGVNLQQRYISIPELREQFCETHRLPREVFDEGLVSLATQNVGRIELSGAPIDTGAKDARFGIKELGYTDEDGLVSTEHTSEQVMRGVEQHGKQYYYLAIHDEELQFTQP